MANSDPWRPMSRFDVRLGRRQLVRVEGVERFVTPIAIEELPLPCDIGARTVLSLRLDDGSVLTGVRLDRLELRDQNANDDRDDDST